MVKILGSAESALKVSPLGFGCMGISAFYDTKLPEEEGVQLIRDAIDRGITFLDTAELYGPFTNETVVGKAIATYPREKLQIATKTGIDPTTFKLNGKPEFIRNACENSLKRLNTPYIDLYYLHRIDVTVPIEETMGELKKLVQEGKIRYVGLSEASPTTIARAHAVHPITAVQLEWSLLSRDVEEKVIPTCRELGIGIVAYSPLGRGMLTGKLKSISENDFRKSTPRFTEENFQHNIALADPLEKMAKEKGVTAGQLALAWVQNQGEDVVAIPGTTKLHRLEENIGSMSISLSKEDMKKLDEIIPPNAVKGDRYQAGGATFLDN